MGRSLNLSANSSRSGSEKESLCQKGGAYKGRKRSLTLAKADELRRHVATGEKRTAIAWEPGISRFTTYEYAPTIPEEKVPTAKRKKIILCVDADDQVLSGRKFMLQMRGYAVKTAKNDEQGMELLKRGGIDLILSRLGTSESMFVSQSNFSKTLAEIRISARQVRSERVAKQGAELIPIISQSRASGCNSLRAIAAQLNTREIEAPRGGQWAAVQVQRVLN